MSAVSLPNLRCHQVYDPRLRELVFRTGDVSIAKDCGVPRSTCNDWKNGKFGDGGRVGCHLDEAHPRPRLAPTAAAGLPG